MARRDTGGAWRGLSRTTGWLHGSPSRRGPCSQPCHGSPSLAWRETWGEARQGRGTGRRDGGERAGRPTGKDKHWDRAGQALWCPCPTYLSRPCHICACPPLSRASSVGCLSLGNQRKTPYRHSACPCPQGLTPYLWRIAAASHACGSQPLSSPARDMLRTGACAPRACAPRACAPTVCVLRTGTCACVCPNSPPGTLSSHLARHGTAPACCTPTAVPVCSQCSRGTAPACCTHMPVWCGAVCSQGSHGTG